MKSNAKARSVAAMKLTWVPSHADAYPKMPRTTTAPKFDGGGGAVVSPFDAPSGGGAADCAAFVEDPGGAAGDGVLDGGAAGCSVGTPTVTVAPGT